MGLLGTQRGWPPRKIDTAATTSRLRPTTAATAAATAAAAATATTQHELVRLVTCLSWSFFSIRSCPPRAPRCGSTLSPVAPLLRTIINGRQAFASARQTVENGRGPEVRSCRALPVSLDASTNLFASSVCSPESWRLLYSRRTRGNLSLSFSPSHRV